MSEIKHTVDFLRPFQVATQETSGEDYNVCLSKVIPLSKSLQQLTADANASSLYLGQNLTAENSQQYKSNQNCQVKICQCQILTAVGALVESNTIPNTVILIAVKFGGNRIALTCQCHRNLQINISVYLPRGQISNQRTWICCCF